jgi:hypothetical protein
MANEAQFGTEAWESSLDALTLQLKAIHELRRSFEPAYRDGRHADPGGKALAQRSQDFLFGLARLQLDHFRQVLQFSNDHFDTVIEQLRRLGKLGAALYGAEARIEVPIRGALGTRVSGTFEIHNIRGKATETRFVSTEFVAEQGGRRAAVPVAVEPTRTDYASVLEPYGTATWKVSLTLDRAAFKAPGRYRATTYVMDKDTVTGILDLVLDAEAPGGGAKRAPASQKAARRVERRRRPK